MELRQIESFFWIATLGSFTAAAKRQFITQSAISARIAELEAELGEPLFDRVGRQLVLTARGDSLLSDARHLLDLCATIKSRGAKRTVSGIVRLGVVNSVAYSWLPELIARVARQYPDIDIHAHVDVSHTVEGKLQQHEIDFAILAGRRSELGFQSESVGQYSCSFLAAPGLKVSRGQLSYKDLAEFRIITYERGTIMHRLLSNLFRDAAVWPVRMTGSNSIQVMMEFAVREIGLCAIPAVVARNYIEAGQLKVIPVNDDLPSIEFTVTRPVSSTSEAATAVADLAVKVGRDFERKHRSLIRGVKLRNASRDRT